MATKTKSLSLNIKPAVDGALSILSDRNRKIVAARHGIGTGQKQTLESIGQNYNITRERVRQIEEASYAKIRGSEEFKTLQPLYAQVEDFLNNNCAVASEELIMDNLSSSADKPYLAFVLALSKDFTKIKENDEYKAAWASSKVHADNAKKLLENLVSKLEKQKTPVSYEELYETASNLNSAKLALGPDNFNNFLGITKKVAQGPFGKWGLAQWSEISPRGVRDKVYIMLGKEKKPLHFRDLAKLIDQGPFDSKTNKKTHPQTVHNELIKDERFVLIGRGIYALQDWGYVSGTVKDVIINVLQEEGRPVEKDVLISKVMEQRLVQKNTILLNLQNRKHFKKVEEGKYHLA